MNKVQFGAMLGKSHAAVDQWENGKTKSLKFETLQKIEKKTGFRAEWVSEGKLPKKASSAASEPPGSNYDISQTVGQLRKIPLISYTQAGEWGEAMDPYQLNDAEDWVEAPVEAGPNSFYIWVKGISMEPYYREGEMLLVDPDIQPLHGDDVIARTPDGNVTFKQYHNTPDGEHLLARNPEFKPRITEAPQGTVIVGVVRGATRKVGRFA